MRTNTTEYEFSHGKKPWGKGFWVLTVIGTDGMGAHATETIYLSMMLTFTEAKKAVIKRFGELHPWADATEIKVLP